MRNLDGNQQVLLVWQFWKGIKEITPVIFIKNATDTSTLCMGVPPVS